MFTKIAVLGLGKVGRLAAELLADAGFDVAGVRRASDRRRAVPRPCRSTLATLTRWARRSPDARPFSPVCLTPSTRRSRRAAHALGLHYFDLTEDVGTTKHIRALARSAKGIMAPQCGLAPGFVGIVGAHLARQFERVRSIRLRVGALPQHPTGLLGYAFNWSPEGVVNEYLNDCEVIEEGVLKTVSAMEWLETVYVGGVRLEAFTTSGGLGTMCETFAGQGREPRLQEPALSGPCFADEFLFPRALMREDRAAAGKILTHAKPPVDDDVVYVHAAAEGWAERTPRPQGIRARLLSDRDRGQAADRDRLDHGRFGRRRDRDGALEALCRARAFSSRRRSRSSASSRRAQDGSTRDMGEAGGRSRRRGGPARAWRSRRAVAVIAGSDRASRSRSPRPIRISAVSDWARPEDRREK